MRRTSEVISACAGRAQGLDCIPACTPSWPGVPWGRASSSPPKSSRRPRVESEQRGEWKWAQTLEDCPSLKEQDTMVRGPTNPPSWEWDPARQTGLQGGWWGEGEPGGGLGESHVFSLSQCPPQPPPPPHGASAVPAQVLWEALPIGGWEELAQAIPEGQRSSREGQSPCLPSLPMGTQNLGGG